ncbi:MAG: gliding motility-associated C-terminal domain-containing protein [Saprospiraceae bacterium]|nr:gliding motility-associated C-terminal domain-containing protein [Saprospiraceae bacterium]
MWRVLPILFSCLGDSLPAFAQTVVFSEDFSGYPNTTTAAPGKWTATGTDCDDLGLNFGNQFGVYAGRFVVNEVEGAPCCTPVGGGNDNRFETVSIDIQAYCEVQISLITGGSGGLDCESPGAPVFGCTGNNQTDDFHDQMLIDILVDGVVVQNKYICGVNGLGQADFTGISGDSLVIRIFAANKFGAETYTFDDIRVLGYAFAPVLPILPDSVFCLTGPPVDLPFQFGGVTGNWSGSGVDAGQFIPLEADTGTHALLFTPNPGQCALPGSVAVSVLPLPEAFPASVLDCSGAAASVDLTAQDAQVSGGAGYPVSWFADPAGMVPIPDPSAFSPVVSVSVYARVTDGNGCLSAPVQVALAIDSCLVGQVNLSCDPTVDANQCILCENGLAPGETASVYADFQFPPPPVGYSLTIAVATPSGTDTLSFTGYTGGAITTTAADTTAVFLLAAQCPNGCADTTGLGDTLTYLLEPEPVIANPGPQQACKGYVLPPLAGQNLPPDAGYYAQPGGNGAAYLPGALITDSTVLFIFADNGLCMDEDSFFIAVNEVPDTTLLQNSSCNPADTGTFVQVLQGFLCDSVVTTVTAFIPPVFSEITDTLCAGESLVLNGTVYDQSNPLGQEILLNASGECDSAVITVNLTFETLVVDIGVEQPLFADAAGSLTIIAVGGGAPPFVYQLDNGPEVLLSQLPQTISLPAGNHVIAVQNVNRCTWSQEVSIAQGPPKSVYIPNAFHPGQKSGLNDVFFIATAPGQVSRIVRLQVFDRWGNLVYEGENLAPNDPANGWDGATRDKDCPPGVYLYVAEVDFADGKQEVFDGEITLIR